MVVVIEMNRPMTWKEQVPSHFPAADQLPDHDYDNDLELTQFNRSANMDPRDIPLTESGFDYRDNDQRSCTRHEDFAGWGVGCQSALGSRVVLKPSPNGNNYIQCQSLI